MDKISLGTFICNRRKELGLSQKDIADSFNISIPTVSKWESDERTPDLSLLGELARLLKVDLESLLKSEISLNNEFDVENKFNIDSFSKYFSYLRKINNLSLAQLSEKIDVRYQTISKWENSESLPNINTFIKCAEIFNVPLPELYYGKSFIKPIIEEKQVIVPDKKIKRTTHLVYLVFIVCLLASLVTSLLYPRKGEPIVVPTIVEVTQESEFDNLAIVTFDFDELAKDISVTITKGSKVDIYDPKIEGYTLSYYHNDELFDFNTLIYDSITIKGIFTINEYNVSFYNQQGDIIDTQKVKYNESAIAPSIESDDDSLKFYKWSIDFANVKSDLSIYPIFIKNEADITFNALDGVCDTQCIYEYDNSMYEDLPVAKKDGYAFLGWYLDDKLFTKNDVIANQIVLIAKYDPLPYVINLDANGGDLDLTTINVLYDQEVILPIPYKENSNFLGWFYEDELVVNKFTYNYTKNIDLIAKYNDVTSDYEYIIDGEEVQLISYKGNDSVVNLPSSILGNVVTKLSKDLFANKENIKEIIIPSSINESEIGVFENLINLEKIYVDANTSLNLHDLFNNNYPELFKSIEITGSGELRCKQLFANCNKSFEIIISSKFDVIDLKFVKDNIKELVLNSASVFARLEIDDYSCLEKVTLKEFYSWYYVTGCANLKEIILYSCECKVIGYDMFVFNTSLEKINIPEGIETIEVFAFAHCSSLKEISLPSTLTFINTDAFINCESLEKVYFEGTKEQWDNILFNNEYSNPMKYAKELYINGELVK